MKASVQILNGLRHQNGLFSASKKTVSTGYNMAWIRDNIYSAMGLESVDPNAVALTFRTLLAIFLKHESKIDAAIKNKPSDKQDYIHARYHPHNLEESNQEWGNKQNDSIGLFLFKLSELTQMGFEIMRTADDLRIVQKLVLYLESIQYHGDADNGVWEENEEVHASSVGACVAGLKKLRQTSFLISGKWHLITVPNELIEKGQETLNRLLPRESATKETDMALLSLIWPYEVVTNEQREQILKNVEEKLVRNRGVIRYIGDRYYNKNGEAEWTMGFPWLAIIYKKLGNHQKHIHYMHKSLKAMNEYNELPELYFADSSEYNENCPLGWAQSLHEVAENA